MGQHDYLNKTPAYITVPPGKTTGWVEVGGLMDTLNHGSWKVTCNALNPPPPPPGQQYLEVKVNFCKEKVTPIMKVPFARRWWRTTL